MKAALVIGCLWALAWLPMGAVLALYAAASPPQAGDLLYRPVDVPVFLLVWTIWGGLSGTGFAVILGMAERRRALSDLSSARLALWGALGAVSAPTVMTAVDLARGLAGSRLYDWRVPVVSVLLSAALGAGCAAATLLVARRAPR